MTIINRALHKAYNRRTESEPAREMTRPASPSVSGWASKLREPIRPLDQPHLEPQVFQPPIDIIPVSQLPGDQLPIDELAVDQLPFDQLDSAGPQLSHDTNSHTQPAGVAVRIDDGHSPTDSPATAPSRPVTEEAATQTPAAIAGSWSWPPIVQRLLTCPAAPELCKLAAHLRNLAAGHELRCVAFSGPGRNVGRTSLVLTLASVLIADKKTRVAIVDADFSHPDAAQLVSLRPENGLEQAINHPEVDGGAVTTLIAGRLAIVPLAKAVAVESIDSRRLGTLQTFLRSLRREYDVVLIDAGPWQTGHPPLVLESRAVDAVVCVCRANSSGEGTADENDLRQPGVEWLGVVETFVAPRAEKRGLAPKGAGQTPE